MPMKIFEAQPVFSKRIITLHIEAESDEELSILIAGPLWGFRSRLESHGVTGAYYEGDKDTRIYYRVLRNLNVSDESQKKKVIDMLGILYVMIISSI